MTSLTCGCGVDYEGQRYALHQQAYYAPGYSIMNTWPTWTSGTEYVVERRWVAKMRKQVQR